MRGASLLLFLLLPLAALAEPLPALYAVTGVSFDDTLNVREKPDAKSPILAKLPPTASDIEVTGWSRDGSWARITTGERPGWVAARFLARQDQADWWQGAVPLFCHGTEPFWSYAVTGAEARFDSPDGQEEPEPLGFRASRPDPAADSVVLGLSTPSGFAIIRNAECSDGMSDRTMALAIDLFRSRDGEPAGYSGCCSLNP